MSVFVFVWISSFSRDSENASLLHNVFAWLFPQTATLFNCDACRLRFEPRNRTFILVADCSPIILQANRTPLESASHSTSHSITPPPPATQNVLATSSTHAPPDISLEDGPKPLVAVPAIDAVHLRNQQAESVISGLAQLKFMLSNEFVTT